MSKKLAPLPWKAGPQNLSVEDYRSRPVASTISPTETERIVACVNACDGIGYPAAVEDLIAAVRAADFLVPPTSAVGKAIRDLELDPNVFPPGTGPDPPRWNSARAPAPPSDK